jgi:hypothetical protein
MMFNFNQSRKFLAIVGCALAGLLSFNSAQAVTETVTAEVAFVAPITISTTTNLQYGALDVAMALGHTIVITPGGGVTDSNGNIVGGIPGPAELSVTATVLQPITILVDSPTNAGGAYNLSLFTCDYDSSGAAPCNGLGLITTSAAAATTDLFVGATLTGTGGAVAGTFDGSVDVTISYQ